MISDIGISSQEDNEYRKLLSDIKKTLDNFSDFNNNQIVKEVFKLIKDDCDILFIHCREPHNIDKIKKSINNKVNVITLLVRNPNVDNIVYNNDSDDNIFNYNYDIVINNDSSIEDLSNKAIDIINELKIPETEEYLEKCMDDIAKHYLSIDTLKTRYSDELDFKEVSVWSLKEALFAAYNLGLNGK